MGYTKVPVWAFPKQRSSVATAHHDLVDAITGRRMAAAFQPIVNIVEGRIAGVEALVRPAPTPSFSTPTELFDRAEELGMLWMLEEAIRRVTFRAAAPWPEGVLLFLNTTPDVAGHPAFAEALLSAAEEIAGLGPERLVIEITERASEARFAEVRRAVDELRERGVQIALDDVGAGSNGLNRISQLRPNWLKLDRELISGIESDTMRQGLVRSMVSFAEEAGIHVIAEGIERKAELGAIVELGITHVQGFLIGCPSTRHAAVDVGAVTRTLEALGKC